MILILLALQNEPKPKKNLLHKPPMGWNSLYAYGVNISEQIIKQNADIFVSRQLNNFGYEYVVIDDGFITKKRDKSGMMIVDKKKFPQGIQQLVSYIHNLGLKAGMEQSDGTQTCRGFAGAFGHEKADAFDYNQWEIDWLKYNDCYNPVEGHFWSPDLGNLTLNGTVYPNTQALFIGSAIMLENGYIGFVGNITGEALFFVKAPAAGKYLATLRYIDKEGYRLFKTQVNDNPWDIHVTTNKTKSSNPVDSLLFYFKIDLVEGDNRIRFYYDGDADYNIKYSFQRMSDALLQEKRDIVFQTNDGGRFHPEKWAHELGHIIRTVEDIVDMKHPNQIGKANWTRIMANYEVNIKNDKISKQNSFYDADSIIIGNDGLTHEEKMSQFTLWCMMNTPLMLSFDLTKMSYETYTIITNQEVININQDDNVVAGTRISASNNKDVIAKPLADGSVAITFLNKDDKKTFDIEINMDQISNFVTIINKDVWLSAKSYKCIDLWTKKETIFDKLAKALNVDRHTVVIFKCTPVSE